MTLLIIYLALALGISFYCSILEASLLSITPGYLAQCEDEKRSYAQRLRRMRTQVDRPLSSILALNTVAHTLGAAGVGAQAQYLWGSESLAIVSGVMTLLILLISEIIPKTLGALHWRKLAPITVQSLHWLTLLFYPLVILSEWINRLLSRFRSGSGHAHGSNTVQKEEIEALARLGEQQGVLGPAEAQVVKSVFYASSLRVRDIMTPRTVMISLNAELSVTDLVQNQVALRFSRLPLWHEHQDDISGYILKDEVLLHAAKTQNSAKLSEFSRTLLIVPEVQTVASFLQQMLDTGEHLALVVDEHGASVGVASMEDAVETLLGLEIVDEADLVRDMRALARARWAQRARKLGLVGSEFPAAP